MDEVGISVLRQYLGELYRLRVETAACANMLTSNDKTTAGQSRRLSLLSCPLNWASSRASLLHIFLHRLIVGKRVIARVTAREGARWRSIGRTVDLDMSENLQASNVALKRHALFRGLL